jgi:hypothetical protein
VETLFPVLSRGVMWTRVLRCGVHRRFTQRAGICVEQEQSLWALSIIRSQTILVQAHSLVDRRNTSGPRGRISSLFPCRTPCNAEKTIVCRKCDPTPSQCPYSPHACHPSPGPLRCHLRSRNSSLRCNAIKITQYAQNRCYKLPMENES